MLVGVCCVTHYCVAVLCGFVCIMVASCCIMFNDQLCVCCCIIIISESSVSHVKCALLPPPDGSLCSIEVTCTGLQDPSQALTRQQGGTDLMGHTDGDVEWKINRSRNQDLLQTHNIMPQNWVGEHILSCCGQVHQEVVIKHSLSVQLHLFHIIQNSMQTLTWSQPF